MWIVQFQYEIYLPVYLCICSFCVDNFQSTPRPNRRIAEWPWNSLWTHWCPHPYLTAAWDAAENSTVIHDQKGSHNLTKWFFFASPEDMKGSKCQKGIHLNRFKVTLPPYTSETTRLCHFHRRWRHRTCPCESGSKNSSPAAQTANREACKWIKDWRMISSVKVRKLTGRIIQEQVTDPNKVCA